MLSVSKIAAELGIPRPISLKSHIMAIGNNNFNSLRKQISWIINTNRVIIFSSGGIEVHVPPKSPIGIPPKRTITYDMKTSIDYVHSSPFYEHVYYHSNGLTDTKTVEKTTNPGPGLHYQWNLKNKTTAPLNGRTAKMKVNLLVKRRPDYEISAPRFSPVYKTIRSRFFNHFFHNGLVAQNYWPSIPDDDDDETNNKNKLKFADQPLYMGQTLIMLSSELHILKLRQENNETIKVIGLINTILDAIENHLVDPASNGYMIRDSITGPDDPLLPPKKYDLVDSDFQKGRENEISQDNYIGLMVGLLHVSRYLEVDNKESRIASQKATQFIAKFFKYIMNSKFMIKRPDGELVFRGEDARGFVTLLHGLYKRATGDDVFDQLEVDLDVGGHRAVIWVGTLWDSGRLISSILQALGQPGNSFTYHMAFSLLCSSEVWAQQDLENVSNKDHLLSIVLYAYYHKTGVMDVPWDKVQQLLNKCDEGGPSNKQQVWNRDNLWVRGGSESPNGIEEQFNGLDYMVLHNLAQIVYQKNIHR